MDIVYLVMSGKEGLLDIEVDLMTLRLLTSNATDELRRATMHGILEMRSFSEDPAGNIQWKNTLFAKSMKNIRYFQEIVYSDYFLPFLSVQRDDPQPNHLLIHTCS